MGGSDRSGKESMIKTKRCPFCHGDGYTVQGEECSECTEKTNYILTEKGLKITSEQYWRDKISAEIMEADFSEAKEISSEWYWATVSTRRACAAIAKGGIGSS